MKKLCIVFFVLVISAMLSACIQLPTPTKSIQKRVDLSPNQAIFLEIESGQVTLVSGRSIGVMNIDGELLDSEQVAFSIKSSDERIDITAQVKQSPFDVFSTPPVNLTVEVPDGYSVNIKTFDAAVVLSDLNGDINVSTVSGDLLAENLAGTVTLTSSRGDVTVKNFSGQLQVLGEHGILKLENVNGKIGSSTIMGSIHYQGRPMPGDEIHFEVDHGPIEIYLPLNSNLDLEISTTSGELVCIAPGLISTGPTCMGTIGSGGASMTVRSVSGSVTLQLSPSIP